MSKAPPRLHAAVLRTVDIILLLESGPKTAQDLCIGLGLEPTENHCAVIRRVLRSMSVRGIAAVCGTRRTRPCGNHPLLWCRPGVTPGTRPGA